MSSRCVDPTSLKKRVHQQEIGNVHDQTSIADRFGRPWNLENCPIPCRELERVTISGEWSMVSGQGDRHCEVRDLGIDLEVMLDRRPANNHD